MSEQDIIAPRSEKQKKFLDSTASITIFGGAMGSGKTYLGIMGFLPYIHIKTFRGLILRKTMPELRGINGILDVALDLFTRVDPPVRGKRKGVQWKSQESKFVFSSGAEISLRGFEHERDEQKLQGLQASLILVDEAQFFSEQQILFLESRNRNARCPEVKPRMMLTANPLKTSFLRKWVDKWLDDEGYPDKEKECATYYASRKDGHMVFADTSKELEYVDEKTGDLVEPKSVTFIPANIYDNPVLMRSDPSYINKLHGMSPVDKAKYLYGNWDAEATGCGYWKREWCDIVDLSPLHTVKKVRAYDIAGTLVSDMNPDPDFTVGVLMSKDKFGTYYIEDVVKYRARFGEVFDRIVATAKEDGDETLIVIPQDAGAAGKAYAMTMIRDLSEQGFYAKAKPTNQSKITRFAPFCAASESGSIKIVKGDWNEDFIQELTDFDGNRKRKRHDDQVDSCGDAFMFLCSTIQIPTFSIPDMTTTNSFSF